MKCDLITFQYDKVWNEQVFVGSDVGWKLKFDRIGHIRSRYAIAGSCGGILEPKTNILFVSIWTLHLGFISIVPCHLMALHTSIPYPLQACTSNIVHSKLFVHYKNIIEASLFPMNAYKITPINV